MKNTDSNLTPQQKREQTMVANYGADWRTKIAQKAAETYKRNHSPEKRAENARNAGKIGGRNSPTKFTKGDARAVRYGQLRRNRATEDRSE